MDIALDPFPYNGGTISAEALWMGVPLLTMGGDRYVSRMGVSMLQNLGIEDWIAVDTQDYINKAITFASDLSALSAMRKGQRAKFLASAVCDAPRFALNLEDAFRDMWRQWCTRKMGKPPFVGQSLEARLFAMSPIATLCTRANYFYFVYDESLVNNPTSVFSASMLSIVR